MTGPLISARELDDLLQRDRRRVRVLDVRWRLDRPDGRSEYETGHIPGAVYVDLETELAAHGARAAEGRHPLPDPDDLQRAARRWGVHDGDTVVAYDDASSMAAGRAWWLLTHGGLRDVRVLDGGLRGWIDAGLPLASTTERAERVAPGDVLIEYGHLPMLDADAAARLPETGALLDARAPERYRGETEPIDPVAGHVPGALNAPATANLDAQGRFRPAPELAARYAALGVDGSAAVGVYCGSGVSATLDVLALRLAGIDAALFPGSWSAWSNDRSRPVAIGAEPDGERSR